MWRVASPPIARSPITWTLLLKKKRTEIFIVFRVYGMDMDRFYSILLPPINKLYNIRLAHLHVFHCFRIYLVSSKDPRKFYRYAFFNTLIFGCGCFYYFYYVQYRIIWSRCTNYRNRRRLRYRQPMLVVFVDISSICNQAKTISCDSLFRINKSAAFIDINWPNSPSRIE